MYKYLIIVLSLCFSCVVCRDWYVGMFKKNDLLVAQDRLFKERVPFACAYAKYGRKFNCPITYFRVVDRLGYGKGPHVEIIRGGLQKQYIVLRLKSGHNTPISVNIYVGCENKIVRTTTTTEHTDAAGQNTTSSVAGGNETTIEGGPGGGNDTAPGSEASGDAKDGAGSTDAGAETTTAESETGGGEK